MIKLVAHTHGDMKKWMIIAKISEPKQMCLSRSVML
jgi:hypothetical protein